jgi:hypothetical protein
MLVREPVARVRSLANPWLGWVAEGSEGSTLVVGAGAVASATDCETSEEGFEETGK